MPSSTVRISEETGRVLREIASREGKSLQAVLDAAIEAYRRHRFLQDANKAYAALREKSGDWKAEKEERKRWEATLLDGQEG